MAKWFFYERVSTKQQKLDRQIYNIELEKFCGRMGITIDNLIVLPEKQSGKDFSRPQYQLLKQVARTGDNIIVCSMDRFGRNYIEGRKEFSEFIGKGIKVYALNRPMLEELYKLDDSASKFMIGN